MIPVRLVFRDGTVKDVNFDSFRPKIDWPIANEVENSNFLETQRVVFEFKYKTLENYYYEEIARQQGEAG